MAKRKHPHQRLGLTFAEYGALLGTRAMLASGELKHDRCTLPKDGEHTFNMEIPSRSNGNCGTVSCIGGTMGLIMGKASWDAHYYVSYHPNNALRQLFYPPQAYDYNKITAQQSVRAIDNFLATGKAMWKAILGNARKQNPYGN